MGQDLKFECMHCVATSRGWFLGFPEIYAGRIRFWKIQDMVQKMCKEEVNNGVSQQRGDVLNIGSNGL